MELWEKSTNAQAVNQWIETTADRSQITENIRVMAGISSNDSSWIHKEGGSARMKRDENDVKKVVDIVQSMVDPFQVSEDLTSISTGIKPSKVTETDLLTAHEKGETKMKQFTEERILMQEVPYFNPISKLQLKTFSMELAQQSVKVGGRDVIVKADRNFSVS